MSSNDSADYFQLPTGTYRHNKSGKLYQVLGTACHSETGEPMVVYRPLYKHDIQQDLFVRPYDMFIQAVEIEGRIMPRFEHLPD